MTDRLDRLHRTMEEGGLTPTPDAVATSYAIRLGDLPPDTRSLNERCGIHLHSINPRRKRPIPDSTEYACPLCLGAPQAGEYVVRLWVKMALETRRLVIIGNLGIDPVTESVEPFEVTFATFTEDLAGNLSMPTSISRHLLGGGLPYGYWHHLIERGLRAR
jgi:hypothetical protein